jgi:hypothetical protein
MLHGTLTVVTKIRPSKVEALEALLEEVNRRIRQGEAHPFKQVDGLYFGRWGILPPGADGVRLLVLGLDFSTEDGRYRRRVNEFIARFVDTLAKRRGGPGAQLFDDIYRSCVGYPAKGLRKPTWVREFLQASSVHYTARHVDFAYRVETAKGMHRLLSLSEEVERYLDTSRRRLERLARNGDHWIEEVHRGLQERLEAIRAARADPEWRRSWNHARLSAARATLLYPALRYLVAFPTVGLFTALGWVEQQVRSGLQRLGSSAAGKASPRVAVQRYQREPQGPVQNPMIHVATLKPGWGSWIALWTTLRSVNVRLQRYVVGLSHIRSIHCARWVLLKTPRGSRGSLFRPKTRRLLFFSNYDGSWESYIDSFIDDPEIRNFLVEIWKGTEDFPPRQSARPFLEPFKAWIHQKQVRTRVWYSAHLHGPEGRTEPAITDLHHTLRLRGLLAQGDVSAPEAEQALGSFLSRGVFAPESPLMSAREWLSYVLTRRAPRELGRRLMQWRRDHVASRAITRIPAEASAPRSAQAAGRRPRARASWLQGHGRRLLPAAEDRGARKSQEVVEGDTP